MQGSRAGRPLLQRRYPYVALSLAIVLVLVLVWVAAAPAATTPKPGSRQQTTFASNSGTILAVKSDGSLWAYGANTNGQLGIGNVATQYSFVRAGTDNDWTAVAAGNDHSLGLKSDGSLWSWGRNNFGQLGDGTRVDRLVPGRVGSDSDWVALGGGTDHSLALKSDGSIWAWGDNKYGQLGDGTTTERLVPTRIGDSNDWLALFAGSHHTLALKKDGSLWGWGSNKFYQLGDGTALDRLVPTRIGTSNDWVEASAGLLHSLALKSDGTLYAWGGNSYGQLGDGTTTTLISPTQIGTSRDWASVSASGFESLAVKADGSLWGTGWCDSNPADDSHIFAPICDDTGWAEAISNMFWVVAAKEDGSLWQWVLPINTVTPVDATRPAQVLAGIAPPGYVSTSTTAVPTTSTTTTTTASTTTTTVPAAKTFSDVPVTNPYYSAISAMAGRNIISGYPDGTFGVDKEVLRKHFAKMIVGAMGLPVTEADWQDSNPPFTDCGPDDPASLYPHDFIAVAKAHGLTAGKTASTFAPEANITRAQMITMVVRAAQNSGITLRPVGADYVSPFKDFDDPNHGANVHLADYNGLLKGLVAGFNPAAWISGNATRGEVAQVLWNLMQMSTH